MSDVFYFGCQGQPGHYWWVPGRDRLKSWERPLGMPWARFDGALTPRKFAVQGAALLHHRDGWTALAIHDYTVDTRPGSNSLFATERVLTADEMIAAASEQWPKTVERIGPIRLMNAEPEAIR